jgi:hypothetical protein
MNNPDKLCWYIMQQTAVIAMILEAFSKTPQTPTIEQFKLPFTLQPVAVPPNGAPSLPPPPVHPIAQQQAADDGKAKMEAQKMAVRGWLKLNKGVSRVR